MNINLPPLHDKQKKILEYCHQSNPAKQINIKASRRGGKSFGIAHALIMMCTSHSNLKVWYMTRSDRQVKDFFNEFFLPLIQACPQLIKGYSAAKGVYFIRWYNDSLLEFKGALSGNSMLGSGLDACAIDEAAYIDEDVISRITMPMFATQRTKDFKPKLIIASSPRGQANHFFKSFMSGFKKNQTDVVSLEFTVFDNPMKNLEWIQMMKNQMSPDVYRQEILGEWIDSAALFANIQECSTGKHQLEVAKGRNLWVSVDIGMVVDATTAFLLSSKEDDLNTLEVLTFWMLDKPDVIDIKNLIIEIDKKYNPKKIVIENNNQGLPIIQSLHFEHNLINVEPFPTTSLSKPIIINNLSYLFNMKQIILPDDEMLKEELTNFCAFPQKNGRMIYEGLKHDDLVMGLAIGAHIWQKEKNTGQYYIKVL